MAHKISIVVLNWNGLADTIECVESLRKLRGTDHEVIIVDNGSTDGSERALRERFPEIEIIQTGANLGFAGGSNRGIARALKSGADYIILLNNDTVVDPGFAAELAAAADRDSDAGILCSKVYFYDRPDVLWYAGADFSVALGWGRMRGYNQTDDGRYDKTEETARPCGCSMMVTRRLCETVGLFDEEYFCYVEDTDLGMRAARAGLKVLFVPSSKVWHKASVSTGGQKTALSLYYNVRNILLCLDRNYPVGLPARLLRRASVLSASLLSLFTMGVPKALGLRRIYQGLRDFHRGRFGEFRG